MSHPVYSNLNCTPPWQASHGPIIPVPNFPFIVFLLTSAYSLPLIKFYQTFKTQLKPYDFYDAL